MEHSRTFNLLFVDDSPNILKALIRTFKKSDYNILTAGSADEALEILNEEDVDLIMADENMPGKTGTELLAAVRVLHPHIIRIMMTGSSDVDVAKNAINKGEIYRFFGKPWDDFEVLTAVRYALETKTVKEENIKLKVMVETQRKAMRKLEESYPGITSKKVTEDGAFIIEE